MKKHKILVAKSSSMIKGQDLSARAIHSSFDSWILDSGASHHMTNSCDLLDSIVHTSTSHIIVGNSS